METGRNGEACWEEPEDVHEVLRECGESSEEDGARGTGWNLPEVMEGILIRRVTQVWTVQGLVTRSQMEMGSKVMETRGEAALKGKWLRAWLNRRRPAACGVRSDAARI